MKRLAGKVPEKIGTQAEREFMQHALFGFTTATGVAVEILEAEPTLAGHRADAALEITHGKHKARYLVEIKQTVPAGAVGHIVAQLQRFNKPAMLITRYVTPPMAERLRELNTAFIDTAGNAYLNAPPIFIYVTGRKPAETEEGVRRIKAFRPTGLHVVFALLCRPELIDAPYRDIARAAHVALGTVGWVMYDLKRLDYLVERGKHGRRLLNLQKLLDAWVTAYAQQLRPKLYVGRFRAQTADWWQTVHWHEVGAFLGGEAAAARLTDYLKPETTTIYVAKDLDTFLIKHRLQRDPTGDVEVLKAFWQFDYPWNHPDLAPPLLVYADLLATAADRTIEAGKMIYDQYLAGLIRHD
jgi:hypothetical protein